MRTLLTLAAAFLTTGAAAGAPLGLRVPPGFEVTEFADSSLANDIYTLAIDTRGRVVVAGRGYVRALEDADGDGKADRAADFADGPKDGAMGLLFEGDSLFCTGDGGLLRYRDADGDGRADGPPERVLSLKTGGEHAAHAVLRGPDRWLYVLCGNNTGVDASYARSPASPVKKPVAGCVLRLSPDLKTTEVVADGFRNAYGMDFNADGELFAYDSDNERCVSLPWYEPTRFYHVLPGGHHGWLSPQLAAWWRLPPYFVDVTAPVVTLGRGSPTGVVCYRHGQFPPRYRGGFFLLDWTFGRVYFVALKRSGASYAGEKEVFLEAVGDNGFAPTGAAVHPETGDLYVSIGGRGTRGAVYRVRYPAGLKGAAPRRVAPRSLDWGPGLGEELVRRAESPDALERVRALSAVERHRQRVDTAIVERVIRANGGHADRYVRQAAARLVAGLGADEARALGRSAGNAREQTTFALGRAGKEDEEVLARCLDVVTRVKEGPEVRLDAVRLVQRALGDVGARSCQGMVWEGYSPRRPLDRDVARRTAAALRPAFPAGHADLDRELSRTLALLEDGDAGTKALVAKLLTGASDPLDDIHYLIVLSRLAGARTKVVTARVADALLALDEKIARRGSTRDSNWPPRMAELHRELARKDEGLNAVLLAHRDFGRPDHAVWAKAPGFDRPRAARLFLARAAREKEYAWNADLVALLGALPAAEARPVLRRLWDAAGLNDVILPLLARDPQPEDRDRFLKGLASPQPAAVRVCLDALQNMADKKDPQTLLALVQALRRLPDGKEEQRLRDEVARYLQRLTGASKPGLDRQAWAEWFRRAHPPLAERVREADGVDIAAWQRRLAAVDWSAGDAARGQSVYVRANCAACHSGAQALGPDLRGVTGRFSRADLFTSILQPSKDVPARYRTTVVVTGDDKVYQGVVIYEAVDSLILMTGAATTVRLANRHIAEKTVSSLSLMPTGLLDALSGRDLADLYAYLRTLGAPPKPRRRRKSGPPLAALTR